MPAAISTTPTMCMKVSGRKWVMRGTSGLRYICHWVRILKNLSVPATIGPMPKPRRSTHQAVFSRLSNISHLHCNGQVIGALVTRDGGTFGAYQFPKML